MEFLADAILVAAIVVTLWAMIGAYDCAIGTVSDAERERQAREDGYVSFRTEWRPVAKVLALAAALAIISQVLHGVAS